MSHFSVMVICDTVDEFEALLAPYQENKLANDQVNHPRHYTQGKVESIDIIERTIDGLDGKQGYHLGNVLKYALRAGKKGLTDIDLEKGNNYAHRLCTGEWRWQREQGKA